MKYALRITREAVTDANAIYDWLAQSSPTGAVRWFDAFLDAPTSVSRDPLACTSAHEGPNLRIDIRERLFRTRRGKAYRLLFTVTGSQVRILRVRAPGQRPLRPDEFHR
jgi:plasmid stabilization system protein ParE